MVMKKSGRKQASFESKIWPTR